MYARSYEKNEFSEDVQPLPSGYRGVAFERETEENEPPSAPAHENAEAVMTSSGAINSPLSFFNRFLPLRRLWPEGKGGMLGSFFSDTEDILLLGIFLLLLLSKEGDTLCAVAVLILLISDKI